MVDSRRLLILYGSQTFTAQEAAERIWRKSKALGFSGPVKSLDEYLISNLIFEQFAVFVCSTTGQGEEPDNMKKSWKFLLRKTLPRTSLSQLKFGVLAFGDSSYPKFNYAGKKLFKRLVQLGANPLLDIGLCDYQHDLGHDAVMQPWLENFFVGLGRYFKMPKEIENAFIPRWTVSLQDVNHTEIQTRHNVANDIYFSNSENDCNAFVLKVDSNIRTTHESNFQDVRLMGFKRPDNSAIDYKPGDVFNIRPRNSKEDVDDLFNIFETHKLNIKPDYILVVKQLHEDCVIMASRNRAHALVNVVVSSNSTGIEDHAPASTTSSLTALSARAQTGIEPLLAVESYVLPENNDQDLIQLEDLIAVNPLTMLCAQPTSKPSSVASATRDADFSPDDESEYEPPNHDALSSESEINEDETNEEEHNRNENTVHFGDMNAGQRRQRNAQPDTWKKNVSKRLRMQGKEYNGYERPRGEKVRNKVRNHRVLGPRCNSDLCKKSKIRSCAEIRDEEREYIFQKFWSEMDWHQRKVYVANNVTYQGKGRQTSENSRRSGTFVYFLPVNNPSDDTTIKRRVCREMFLRTLCLGSFSVQNWAKRGRCGMHPSENLMNLNRQRPRALLSERRTEVLNSFLDQLPKMPSHYNRQNTNKVYLEPIYRNAAHLYSTYKQFCLEKGEEPYARNKFHTAIKNRNIAIHTIKKDMCDICVGHQTGNVYDGDFHTHLRKKNRAREEKNRDKSEAIKGNCIVLTMDLQAVKVCPFITASAVYYKTKLCVHNFTIYDLASHDCTCYWFNETDGDLTASTYASFITDYLTRHCLPKRLPIIIYSDGCTSQNRNNILANALLNFSMQHEVSIVQKYLEVGHTQMEGDCVHSAIERKLKNRLIHLPSDFLSVTKEARKNPREYECLMVNHTFFKNFSDPGTWRYTSIRPGRKAGDPKVTDIRAILYDREGTIRFKLDFDSDWESLPQRVNKLTVIREYGPLHRNRLPITLQKYKHLQELKSVIPLDCHSFYDDLPHSDN